MQDGWFWFLGSDRTTPQKTCVQVYVHMDTPLDFLLVDYITLDNWQLDMGINCFTLEVASDDLNNLLMHKRYHQILPFSRDKCVCVNWGLRH